MRPGEVSLAHGGVLFLDEVGEFQPAVLDGLRQPLEEGSVRVNRARAAVEFPARFQLVGAMNPCPCGAAGQAGRVPVRRRTATEVPASGLGPAARPVRPPPRGGPPRCRRAARRARWVKPSAVVAGRVRAGPGDRWLRGYDLNADIPGHLLDEMAPSPKAARLLLRRELEADRLTGRGLHRVRRVARTLADLHHEHGDIDEQWVSHGAQPRASTRSSTPGGPPDDRRAPPRSRLRGRARRVGSHDPPSAGPCSPAPGPARSAVGRPRLGAAVGGRGAGPAGRREARACAAAWRQGAALVDVRALWGRCRAESVLRSSGAPATRTSSPRTRFRRRCSSPGAIPAVLRQRTVAIVGTRNATAGGMEVAARLGYDLAASGISVVSGLARGIDGAAHRGALAAATGGAPPIGVRGQRSRCDLPPSASGPVGGGSDAGVALRRGAPRGRRRAPTASRPATGSWPAWQRCWSSWSPGSGAARSSPSGRRAVGASRSWRCRVPCATRPRKARTCCWSTGRSRSSTALDVLVALGLEAAARRNGAGRTGGPRPIRSIAPCSISSAPTRSRSTRLVLRSDRPLPEVAVALGRLEGRGTGSPGPGPGSSVRVPEVGHEGSLPSCCALASRRVRGVAHRRGAEHRRPRTGATCAASWTGWDAPASPIRSTSTGSCSAGTWPIWPRGTSRRGAWPARPPALRRYFAWLRHVGTIETDPARSLSAPTGPGRLPRVLGARRSPSCSTNRRASVDGDPVPIRLRDDVVLEILYGCGLRVGRAVPGSTYPTSPSAVPCADGLGQGRQAASSAARGARTTSPWRPGWPRAGRRSWPTAPCRHLYSFNVGIRFVGPAIAQNGLIGVNDLGPVRQVQGHPSCIALVNDIFGDDFHHHRITYLFGLFGRPLQDCEI